MSAHLAVPRRAACGCPARLPDQAGLSCPHHPDKARPHPKAGNNGRAMTGCWHLVHADVGSCLEHRLEVRRDVAQRGNAVPPRAREYETAAIEPAEVRPLK